MSLHLDLNRHYNSGHIQFKKIAMKKTEDLEKKIAELEYRLSVLEKFLDLPSGLFHKDDESTMNSIRIEVLRNMEKEGLDVEKVKEIWGTKFYRKG